MQRITTAQIENKIKALNEKLNRPLAPRGKDGAQIGNLHLCVAYGGWQVCEIVNKSGGVRNISSGGYVTKRELYNQLSFGLNLPTLKN